MTDREALLTLAERVEKATRPDRELDRDIAAALRIGPVYKLRGRISASWPVTASLDAAMTLVPERWTYLIDNTDGVEKVELYPPYSPDAPPIMHGSHPTSLAHALTAACLRAHATKGGEG